MVFTADLGNSSIALAVFNRDGSLVFRSNLSTDRAKCEDEYLILLQNIFALYGVEPSAQGAIISSVVPQLTHSFSSAVSRLLGCKPLVVGPGIKTGLDIKIDQHSQLGSDLVANTVGAMAVHTPPFVIVDMGTATTITAVNPKSELCGVIILPGVRVALDALSANAAELPYISLDSPRALLGTNTIDAMNSGIVYGSACMIDGLVDRLSEEFHAAGMTIIATGGLASTIIPYCRHKMIHAPNLVLEGLFQIYKKNQKRSKSM
jgi:type III pantothenate kinase